MTDRLERAPAHEISTFVSAFRPDLELLAEKPRTIGEIFRDLMHEKEPPPWLCDLMLLSVIEAMKCTRQPVLTFAPDDNNQHWWKERLTISPVGLAVLAAGVDWLSLSPPERWLDGVHETTAFC
jgi:hypothetical protein